MPGRRRIACLGALIAVLGMSVLSACGTSSGGSGGGSSEPRSTQAEMVTQADAVCTKGLEEAEALRTTSDPTARGRVAAAEVDATLAALDRQVRGLAKLRGPASTDHVLDTVVRELRAAAAGLKKLQAVIVRNNSTINDAVRSSGNLVGRINRATAKATDALRKLGFLTCIGLAAESE